MGFENKNFRKLWYWILIILVGFVISIISMNYETNRVFEDYPIMKSYNSVNRVILESKRYKGTTLLKDSDGHSFSIRAWFIGKESNDLNFYIEPGDSIARKSGIDTLFLYKKESKEKLVFIVQCLE